MRTASLLLLVGFLVGCTSGQFRPASSEGVVPNVIQNGSPPPQWVFLTPVGSISPDALVAGADHNIWYAAGAEIDSVTMLGIPTRYTLPGPGAALEITAGKKDLLWFCGGDGLVGSISTTGAISEYYVSDHNVISDLALGPDGDIWFTDTAANKIGRITRTGRIREFVVPGPISPGYITKGPDDALWFTAYDSIAQNGYVGRIDTLGSVTLFDTGGRPYQITAGSDGNLWYGDLTDEAIVKITTGGATTTYPLSPQFNLPYAVTEGPDGNVWYASESGSSDNYIGNITPGGTISQFVMPPGTCCTSDLALYIAPGPDGNIWFNQDGRPQLGVYLLRVLSVNPTSIEFSGPNQTKQVRVQETGFGGTWNVTSSNTAVATVAPGPKRQLFEVTSVGSGNAIVTVADTKRNYFQVSVSVP